MEDDMDVTLPGQQSGLYIDGASDTEFILPCLAHHSMHASTTPQCSPCLSLLNAFMVGACSHCHIKWEAPNGDFVNSFHEVKIIQTTRGQKKQEITFSITKTPLCDGTVGIGLKGFVLLTTPQILGGTMSSTRFLRRHMRHINGKATFQGNTSSIGHMFGILYDLIRTQPSCGLQFRFQIRQKPKKSNQERLKR